MRGLVDITVPPVPGSIGSTGLPEVELWISRLFDLILVNLRS